MTARIAAITSHSETSNRRHSDHVPLESSQIPWGARHASESHIGQGRLAEPWEAERPLTAGDVWALIVNKMIGSGIFVGPYMALQDCQDKNIFIVLWVLGFLYTIFSMALYLEYARDLPYTGGELIYLDHTIYKPRLLAYTEYAFYFVFVYTSATNALQFGRQVLIAIDRSNLNGDALRYLAITMFTTICALLYFSTTGSRFINQFTAYLKVVLLVNGAVSGSTISNPPPGQTTDWARAFLAILFSYHGWENATLVAGEIPAYRTLKKGFLRGVCTVGVLYLFIAITFCFAFSWTEIENNQGPAVDYLASYLGGDDGAKQATAIIVAFSAAGSAISVSYTCVKVKQAIAWTRILPWSSLWRREAPQREIAMDQGMSSDESSLGRPIRARKTPEGGIILHWLATLVYICITAAFRNVVNGISFTGNILVFGHFFASIFVGGAFPWYAPGKNTTWLPPSWEPGKPPQCLYDGKLSSWVYKCIMGVIPLGFGVAVLVTVAKSAADRSLFYVMICILGTGGLYWFLFINYGQLMSHAGFTLKHAYHGQDDARNRWTQCDRCADFYPPEKHRHAQEGYLAYNDVVVTSHGGGKHPGRLTRSLYALFGGTDHRLTLNVRWEILHPIRILAWARGLFGR